MLSSPEITLPCKWLTEIGFRVKMTVMDICPAGEFNTAVLNSDQAIGDK